jgi:short subunit dehydrogenase-like uncharacterized protein
VRSFDLVLFGATGFTGQLVAEYLVKKKSAGVRLALAGRDRGKLETLARGLGASVPILVGNVRDPASIDAIARQTRVVCTTVGPYATYGGPLVAACAEHGTDYCDLTGELQWVRRMMDAHEGTAKRTGARIVPSCGFDSIPSDLGVAVLQGYAKARHGAPCDRITYAVTKLRGGASGGTVASMLQMVEEATVDAGVRALLKDAYCLNPVGEREGPDDARFHGAAWDAELGAWTAPFVMGAINERVVRRTNAISGFAYGRSFRYREVVAFPRGPAGFALSVGAAFGLGAFAVAAAVPPVRALLRHTVLPSPGEGPSEQRRARGCFEITLLGQGRSKDGRPFTVRGKVAGQGDPGYAATSRMLGEAALCLALDESSSQGGFLTPAVAMGDRLVARLRAAGMTLHAGET